MIKDEYPTKAIQISPAMNSSLWDDHDDPLYHSGTQVFVNCAKEVLYEAYDAETGGNLVDRRLLNFQEWQVSDYVIYYDESIPIARIELTILNVYDENYSLVSEEATSEYGYASSCKDNYGGFAEIYWHLDATSDPSLVRVEYGNVYGEDSIRQRSISKSTMIDSGDYFTNVNDRKICLLGINSNFYVGVSKNDKGTNERYQIGNSCTIQGSNANISSQFTRELREEMARESQEMRDTQLITMFISVVIVAAILAAVFTAGQSLWVAYGAAGLGGLGMSAFGSAIVSGIAAGFIAGVKMGAIYLAFMGGLTWLSTVCPTGAAYLSMAFDSVDAYVSFATMTVCWWLDVPIHLINPTFNSIIVIGPFIFGLYSSTLDLGGTLPRWLTVNHMNKFYPNQGDFRHVIFENYEIAMMTGQYYDFFGKYSSDLGCGPGWFGGG